MHETWRIHWRQAETASHGCTAADSNPRWVSRTPSRPAGPRVTIPAVFLGCCGSRLSKWRPYATCMFVLWRKATRYGYGADELDIEDIADNLDDRVTQCLPFYVGRKL